MERVRDRQMMVMLNSRVVHAGSRAWGYDWWF